MIGLTATEFVERRDRNNRRFAAAVLAIDASAPVHRNLSDLVECAHAILVEELPGAEFTADAVARRSKELWEYARACHTERLIYGCELPAALRSVPADNFVALDDRGMAFYDRVHRKPWERH